MLVLLACSASQFAAQEKAEESLQSYVKRCTPQFVKRMESSKPEALHFRRGEKPTGFSPVISVEILESGDVAHARVKRSSGIAGEDSLALKWVQSFKYKPRSVGCGIVESNVVVTIDLQ